MKTEKEILEKKQAIEELQSNLDPDDDDNIVEIEYYSGMIEMLNWVIS